MNVMNQFIFIVTVKEEVDRASSEPHGIPGAMLYATLGTAVFNLLRTALVAARNVVIVCGPGNNGGGR